MSLRAIPTKPCRRCQSPQLPFDLDTGCTRCGYWEGQDEIETSQSPLPGFAPDGDGGWKHTIRAPFTNSVVGVLHLVPNPTPIVEEHLLQEVLYPAIKQPNKP